MASKAAPPERRGSQPIRRYGVLALVAIVVLVGGCAASERAPVASNDPLVVTGARLFRDQGCLVCHSTDGGLGAGPTMRHLAGATVRLADGGQVAADDDYLLRSILDPDAEITKGYPPHTMGATAAMRPEDARAIVAYIKTLR